MNTINQRLALFSLSILWIFTGITSFYFSPEIGYEILEKAGIKDFTAELLLVSGSILDILIGFWLLSKYQLKWCLKFQISVIIFYSILLSFIAPEFWLHPFGPITKNLPIIALILVLLDHINDTSKANTT